MHGKKDFQDFPIADPRGIEGNLDDLGMSGRSRANLFVGRIGNMTAHVAGNNVFDAFNVFEYCLEAPKTSASEGGLFKFSGCRLPFAVMSQSPCLFASG